MNHNPVETPFRLRVLIGSSETLSGWIGVCPACHRSFRLHWPNSVLYVPLHRVLDMRCPICGKSGSVVAGSLVPDDEGAELPDCIVERLS